MEALTDLSRIGSGLLIVPVGPPGCGKSTLSDILFRTGEFQVVSSDAIRKEVHGDKTVQKDPARIFSIAHARASSLLAYTNVVFDATNCEPAHRRTLIDNVSESLEYAVAVAFDDPLDDCLDRNFNRERNVPGGVVKRMWEQLQMFPPCTDEGFDEVMTPNELLERLAIFSRP